MLIDALDVEPEILTRRPTIQLWPRGVTARMKSQLVKMIEQHPVYGLGSELIKCPLLEGGFGNEDRANALDCSGILLRLIRIWLINAEIRVPAAAGLAAGPVFTDSYLRPVPFEVVDHDFNNLRGA